MIHRKISYVSLLILILSLVLASCGTSPEEIAQIVDQTVEARPPVVEVMEETVEVTRIVEVPVEMEVTRLVEVEATVEVEVEVTRVVEVEITSTPEPTPTATATAVPQPAANSNQGSSGTGSGDVNADVLAHLEYVYSRLNDYRGNLSGPINCRVEIEIVDELAVIRQFDLSAATPETQNAYNNYVNGITVFQQGARDLDTHCRDFLAENSTSSNQVTNDKYGFALNGVEDAKNILRSAIQSLGGNADD